MPFKEQLRNSLKWVGLISLIFVGVISLFNAPAPNSKEPASEMQAEMEEERYDQPGEALTFYAGQRLPAGVTALSASMYDDGMRQLNALPQMDVSTMKPVNGIVQAGSPWSDIGPGNVGGRTRAILIDPNTPATMYAGGVAGGIWKSTDSGSTWTILDDFMENMAVTTLAFDPANPNTIYAGTGEGVFNVDAVRGDGIFVSIDAGVTWTQIASTANNSNFYYVMDVVVSPNNSSHIYAATRTGVWRSTNGGTSWTQVVNHSGVNSRCTDLAIRTGTSSSDTVFAACGTFSIQGVIYRTTDGATWSSVYTEANMGRTELAIAPSNQNTIYGLVSSTASGNYQYGLLRVIRSTTGGDSGSWLSRVDNGDPTLQNTLLLTNPYMRCNFDSYFNQGWYDNVIAVDPTDANTVWAGGIDLFKSTDGGASWAAASIWWNDTDTWYVHADQHAIVFHPNYDGSSNETMYVGNDGGIFRTNAAASGTTQDPCNVFSSLADFGWTSLNNGYNITQFYHGDTYPTGTTYFGGTQDNGTNLGTTASTSWTEINGGDGGYVAVDPSNTSILFAETTNLSIRKSTDGGVNFATSTTGITEAPGNFQFINPFIMDPNNSNRLWTGGCTLWRTDNQGTSWTQASITNQVSGSCATIPMNSIASWAVQPGNSNLVMAGDEIGNIYRNTAATSATSGTTWTDVANMGGYVSSISFDPNSASTVYATVSTFGATHLWQSTDSGATWAAFGGTLPDIPFHSVLVETGNSNRIFVGTDRGIIMTMDGGTTWCYAQGFPRVPAEWMDEETESGTTYLYAFTHGRGALCAPISTIPTNVTLQDVSGTPVNTLTIGILAVAGAFVLLTLGVLWRRREKTAV